jgi:hypothetical protein
LNQAARQPQQQARVTSQALQRTGVFPIKAIFEGCHLP